MKTYTAQAVALYALGLVLACFLNLDKLYPWYIQETMDLESPAATVFEKADALRQSSGVAAAVDHFDCSMSFLFNDTYKDNTKCYDLGSSAAPAPDGGAMADLASLWRRMSPEQREAAAMSLYGSLRSLPSQGRVMEAHHATYAGHKADLLIVSTGNDQPQVTLGLEDSLTPKRPEQARKVPLRSVLIVGDSLALGLAPPFERALKEYNESIDFARVGKVSSGLAIPHLFDWEKKVQVLIEKHHPDLIIVMMGVNDANNNIRIDDRKAILGTAAWPLAYQERVTRFISIIMERNVPTYWVGLPVVRDEAMTSRIEIANSAAKKACEEFEHCHFIDTRSILTDDNGNYTNYKKDNKGYSIRIREQDGIHFSTQGGDLLSRFILDYISQYVQLRPVAQDGKSI